MASAPSEDIGPIVTHASSAQSRIPVWRCVEYDGGHEEVNLYEFLPTIKSREDRARVVVSAFRDVIESHTSCSSSLVEIRRICDAGASVDWEARIQSPLIVRVDGDREEDPLILSQSIVEERGARVEESVDLDLSNIDNPELRAQCVLSQIRHVLASTTNSTTLVSKISALCVESTRVQAFGQLTSQTTNWPPTPSRHPGLSRTPSPPRGCSRSRSRSRSRIRASERSDQSGSGSQ